MAEFVLLSEKNRERYLRIISPAGKLMARLGVHPNILSLAGLVLSAFAGLIYSTGSFFWGAWVLVLAGTCDALDGQLARQVGKDSPFGAFFDSTLDRFSEVLVFLGLAWHFSGGAVFWNFKAGNSSDIQSPLAVLFIILAIAGDQSFRQAVDTIFLDSARFRVSVWWLIAFFMVLTMGELCLSPVGLSLVTKLAPAKHVGLFMGGWFLATAVAEYTAQVFGAYWGKMVPGQYFLIFVVMCGAGALLMAVLIRPMKRMMHGVH